MKFENAFVVANPEKPEAVAVADEIRKFLSEKGKLAAAGDKASLLIAVGGDGTLLTAKEGTDSPVIGIGGEKSKLCAFKTSEWQEKLPLFFDGFEAEKRLMLASWIGDKKLEAALNDVVLYSNDHHGIWVKLLIDGNEHKFYCDSVVFSTATGSTAYCYSAGGKIMTPTSRRYQVVAAAPYMRAFKPVTVRANSVCEVCIERGNAAVVVDGQFVHQIKEQTLRVKKGDNLFLVLNPEPKASA